MNNDAGTAFSDAHAHPFVLRDFFPGPGPDGAMEGERRAFRAACAASACTREEFEYHEALSRRARAEGAPPLIPCFGVHPQLCGPGPGGSGGRDAAEKGRERPAHGAAPLSVPAAGLPPHPPAVKESLESLERFAAAGRLGAVGECGFDLYGTFRESEAAQDRIFPLHLETAREKGLPLVLHARRAAHKIFALTKEFRRLPALIFHSCPLSLEEGRALLSRGINAWFSFGTVIALNHRQAMRAAALLPLDRLLTETDAPFQPLRGSPFSRPADLPRIAGTLASLRREAGSGGADEGELAEALMRNFRAAFGLAAD